MKLLALDRDKKAIKICDYVYWEGKECFVYNILSKKRISIECDGESVDIESKKVSVTPPPAAPPAPKIVLPPAKKGPILKIEFNFASGWADSGWTRGSAPMRFRTRPAAQAEIDEFIANMKGQYTQSQYRISIA